MKAEIAERYEDAVEYDAMMSKIFPGYDLLPEIAASYLRLKIGGNAHLLDVGCGTGTALVSHATAHPQWTLVGVDPTESMLGLAREKLAAQGLTDRVRLVHGTLDALPADERFDAVTMTLVEHLQPDDGTKHELLSRVADRLIPGGWLVLAGLHGDFDSEESRMGLDAWIGLLAARGFPAPMLEGVRNKATVEDSPVSEARLRELLTGVGLRHITQIYRAQLLGAWLAQKA